MAIREIKDINILRSLDVSDIEEIKYSGLIYKKINIIGETKSSVLFYNKFERHLIKIKWPNYLLASYIILHKISENVYKKI